MCGIAGALSADPRPGLARSVDAMGAAQAHRGPDGRGLWLAGGDGPGHLVHEAPAPATPGGERVVLGHRRLAVLDPEGGAQPMGDPEAGVWLTYNGEVYNFRDLARELEGRGHRFHTRGDTEVVLRAFVEWGEEALERLVGMFALAVWDARRRRLTLVRDRLGIKPLHYAHLGDRFLFASELKGILAAGGVPTGLDPVSLGRYLAHDYVPAPGTIYRAVCKLEAGHRLVVRLDPGRGLELEGPAPWWTLDPVVETHRSEASWREEVRARVDEAVRERLVADVPLGAFLSGGVDSGAVVASMAAARGAAGGAVRTFCIGFPDPGRSEAAHAARVARRVGAEHAEMTVHPDLLDVVPRLVDHHDEPFADASAVPTHYLCREIRRSVTVALSGDGGDEVFAGYRHYRQARVVQRWARWAPAVVRRAAPAGPLPAPRRSRWSLGQRLAGATGPFEVYRSLVSTAGPDLGGRFLRPEVRRELGYVGGGPDDGWLRGIWDAPSAAGDLTRMQYADLRSYLPEDVLTKVDRASMAHSLEVRVPLLDHRLVELSFRAPPSLQIRGGVQKWLLKEAFRDRLDLETRTREKQGFGIPVDAWFRQGGVLAGLVDDHFAGAPDPYLEPSALRGLLAEHRAGRGPWGHVLWNLLVLRIWLGRDAAPAGA